MAREGIALPLPPERVERDADTARTYNPRGEVARVKDPVRKGQPSVRTLKRWVMDGVAEATDGCTVEPDGECEHGCQSWLIELGFI